MIGMLRVRSRRLMCAAVSKPSIPGMRTSSRMRAKSWVSSAFSASSPDRTGYGSTSSELRLASSAMRFSSRSSTKRILARSGIRRTPFPRFGPPGGPALGAALGEPAAEPIEQEVHVDRLGHVVGRAGGDALLPVPVHDLGGQRDDREV